MPTSIRVFVAAAGSEFGTERNEIVGALRRRRMDARSMRDFRGRPDEASTLRDLRDFILDCDAVVAIMGSRSGGFPPDDVAEPYVAMLPPGFDRASMAQWALHFARHYRRPLMIYLASGEHPIAAPQGRDDDPALQRRLLAYLLRHKRIDCRGFRNRDELMSQILKETWRRSETESESSQEEPLPRALDDEDLMWLALSRRRGAATRDPAAMEREARAGVQESLASKFSVDDMDARAPELRVQEWAPLPEAAVADSAPWPAPPMSPSRSLQPNRNFRLGRLTLLAVAAVGAALVVGGAVAVLLTFKSIFHSSLSMLPAAPQPPATVDVSAYAPKRSARGKKFLVQVFFHDTAADATDILEQAREADVEAVRRGLATLDLEIASGDRLDIVLDASGLEIEEPQQSMIWRGRPRSCAFFVTVPETFSEDTAYLRVRVLRQAVPVGQIRFAMGVAAELPAQPIVATGDAARRYRRAFLSYASSDRAEVLKRAQALRSARIDFFNDLLSLSPGERWEKKLYSEIEHCDLFLLFWSNAARDSEWVAKEIDHALACFGRKGADVPEILPILLEGPPPPAPPDKLADRQFNDPLLYVIASIEKLRQSRAAS
jgi:hypothetical protein